jgi:hypothetical protein
MQDETGKLEAGVTYLNTVGAMASDAANEVWHQKVRCAILLQTRPSAFQERH